MDRDHISQLQPLKFCDGWSVVLNNLESEKIRKKNMNY
ncbi:hypothetical protein BSBH6_04198 [Bacillus subtilis]|nr:hypothetical protein BSBH6_04198 [Bacillus subtilis]RPK19846.1 hypothetical protein BH5_04199 [Bacillus subtilis]